jgi:MOSC domain-containing protein YiiM
MILHIRSVNVAVPQVIAILNDRPVVSAIAKQPVSEGRIHVGRTNLSGDAQGDLSVHGGVDKAVYAYPMENWPWWEGDHGLACRPATFGENLTLEGGDENDVRIGDRFRWGDAVLEVSQPRAPCFKLALHTRRDDVPPLMTLSSRCGFYSRVVEEGEAPVRDGLLTRIASIGGPTVSETFRALFDRRSDPAFCAQLCEMPELAEAWRKGLARKLAGRG